jgi:hypothetical protein
MPDFATGARGFLPGRLAVARVLPADGSMAAAGHMALVEDAAIFDASVRT